MTSTPSQKQEHHLPVLNENQSAVDLLTHATGLSKQRIKTAMQKGAVWLTHKDHTRRLRRVKQTLHPNDTLHLYYNETILAEIPPPPHLIADETAYSVWHKPYGLRSQGSKWSDHCTLVRWAEQHLHPERPAFTVHRLDRAATGLMLIAHQKRTAAALSALFRNRAVEKTYHALTHGHVLSSTTTVTDPIDNKTAISHITGIGYAPTHNRSLVRVTIETGRKHQIRRHLSTLGFPIIGDLYGQPGDLEDLQLTAVTLAFPCPLTGTPKHYILPPHLAPVLAPTN